ncbi:protein kinase [Pleurocapsa sp. PCC 7319]|uniref:serine/threonine-protein kinase n=1 Tax=Pleurocapsa sp. PCC 7319 TaxID=118161 RepID=UPI0003465075|nr:serine/threonine-protein kinase [Pleurocapsa sp. PCC 7319]
MNNEIDFESGKNINNKYKILKKIGEGTFGETYITQIIHQPGSLCVIKKLKSKFEDPEILQEARSRFLKEIRTLELLAANPQIPELLDSFEINGEFYLVQQWIDGQNILEEIEEQGSLSEIEVIKLLQSTLETLDFVHQQGIIHRDIKPSNLMRRKEDGKIFLIDFGAMKQIPTLCFNSKTQNYFTKIIGTRDYMPIEQLRGTPTFSSDIYSLGITAVYALTGQKPEIELNSNESYGFPKWQKDDNVSRELESILDKMIHPNIYRNRSGLCRYQSALEVLQDLEPLLKIQVTLGGRYKIWQYLGGSIWGYTYLAEDIYARHLHSQCIVKSLRPQNNRLSHDAEERFNKELAVLRALGEHEQIPGFFNEFAENEEIYFVREFINGNDLAQEIKSKKKLEENNVIRILFDVLEILQFVHGKRIIHRDIKPSNLIRRASDGKIVLIDFGAVKEIVQLSSNSSRITLSTQAVGTEGYMSPEQSSKRPIFASDIYALGMTAIHLLTGKHPQQFQTDPETGKLLWRNETEVSQDLAEILDKMIKVGLGKGGRYQSCDEVLSALKRKFNKIKLNSSSKIRSQGRMNILHKINWKISILSLFTILLVITLLSKLTTNKGYKYTFREGVELVKQKKYHEAIAKFDEVLAINANYYQALINRGIAQGYLKQYADMLASCQLAITIRKHDSYAWNCKGEALHNLNRHEDSLISFNKAIVLNSQDPYYWFNKAESLLALKENQQSIESIDKAISIVEESSEGITDPTFLSILYSSKGRNLREIKQYDQALAVYTQALELNPNYFPALRDVGIVFKNLKQYDQARDQFNKIIDSQKFTDEQKAQVYYFNGLTWCEQKNYPMAQDSFDNALKIKPDYQSAEKAKAACWN